jgi:hypothetical protein
MVDTGVMGPGDADLRSQIDYLKRYDPYDTSVDWSKYGGHAAMTDDEINATAGKDYGRASRLADKRAMERRAILAELNPAPTRPVQPKPVARQILENFQGARPSVTPMNFGESLNDAYSMLNAPATPVAVAPVAPASPASPAAQAPAVAPVAQQPAPVPVGAGARAIDTLVGSDLANPEDLDERAQDNFMQSQAGQALWKATGGDAAVRKSSGAYAADLANAVGNAGTRLYAGVGRAMNPVLRQAKENLALSTLGQFLGMTPPTR